MPCVTPFRARLARGNPVRDPVAQTSHRREPVRASVAQTDLTQSASEGPSRRGTHSPRTAQVYGAPPSPKARPRRAPRAALRETNLRGGAHDSGLVAHTPHRPARDGTLRDGRSGAITYLPPSRLAGFPWSDSPSTPCTMPPIPHTTFSKGKVRSLHASLCRLPAREQDVLARLHQVQLLKQDWQAQASLEAHLSLSQGCASGKSRAAGVFLDEAVLAHSAACLFLPRRAGAQQGAAAPLDQVRIHLDAANPGPGGDPCFAHFMDDGGPEQASDTISSALGAMAGFSCR